ncbi:hypothetical protein CBR_g46260 [Chara braunii]|uniref:Reverse transcriptase RNase H-like domain-containing protein n=1 Tax=Chara braunii TaxID=69332 RepID=A0A388K3U5_CHABU|nr:hypothetical protein CBR_g46260 [Chara braunii]|eukprot:GBG64717.1 hypothetical protein CBR_g46260 [Chara braunii]
MGRYRQKLMDMCEEVESWRAGIPKVFLYDSGPESMPGRQRYPGVTTVSSGPRSGMTHRPPTTLAQAAFAARTRGQAKVGAGQDPPKRESELERRKEPVEVQDYDDEDEEDEKLQQEEDRRAEQRARKRGSQEEVEPVLRDVTPNKKKYVVGLEEGFDVERLIDRLLEGHNDLMTLKEILASAPRLRNEPKGRLSRRLVPSVRLSVILSKEVEWADSRTKMDWKCVACGMVDLVVKGSKCVAMVGTRAEMNIIREADAIKYGLDIDHVRNFLGTCGFWRTFVKNFAAKTEQLRKLVRQDQEWVWGEEQEKVVSGMKEEFRKGGLVLGASDYDATEVRSFIVETDAGPTALGGVLIQADIEGKERPLHFESRTLCTSERNYSQFKRETLVVLHCLRIFRNYIFGRRFILRVDPTTLAFSLRNYVPSDPTVARWLTYIWMFNFELERIPGSKNRADGLSRINWDKEEGEAIENTPPVDGFLDQEEDILRHINEWSPRVPSCVGHLIWHAPKGYERKVELVLKPFEEEDPWGGKDVQWMMKFALASNHSLVEEVRTIEEDPDRVRMHEELMGDIYLLVNTLLQEPSDLIGSLNPAEGEDVVLESQDDGFEEGEIKEAFRAEEYDGIYRELGLLLSSDFAKTAMPRGGREVRPSRRPSGASGGHERRGSYQREYTPEYDNGDIELFLDDYWSYARPIARICEEARTWQEVEQAMQRLRPSPVGTDGESIRLQIGNAEEFIPTFERFMHEQGILRDQWMQTLPLWTRRAERPLAREIRDRARDWEGCRAHVREAFRRPEPAQPQPRVERRLRSKRQREPEPRETTPSRGGRKALARRDEEPDQPEQESGMYPECGMRPVAVQPFTEGRLQGSLQQVSEEAAPAGGSLQSLEAHLDALQWEVPQSSGGQEAEPRAQREQQKEVVIEIGEDTLPQQSAPTPEVEAEPMDVQEEGREPQRGETPPPPPNLIQSPKVRVETEPGETDWRKEVISTVDSFDRYLMLEGDLAGKKAKEEGHGVRIEALEAEIQDLKALAASQATIIQRLLEERKKEGTPTKVVDQTEGARYDVQGQAAQGSGQPSEAGPSQGPPLGRVILGPEEAKAKREAEKEAFVFRAPTAFATLPVEPLGAPPTSSPLPGEEGPQGATSEPTQGSMEGPMSVLLEALDTMQEGASTPMPELGTKTVSEELPMVVPEERRKSRPQRLDTPEYVPEQPAFSAMEQATMRISKG